MAINVKKKYLVTINATINKNNLPSVLSNRRTG